MPQVLERCRVKGHATVNGSAVKKFNGRHMSIHLLCNPIKDRLKCPFQNFLLFMIFDSLDGCSRHGLARVDGGTSFLLHRRGLCCRGSSMALPRIRRSVIGYTAHTKTHFGTHARVRRKMNYGVLGIFLRGICMFNFTGKDQLNSVPSGVAELAGHVCQNDSNQRVVNA